MPDGTTPAMPKPSAAAQAAFRALLRARAEVTVRPMFGNLAGFANGNMFGGLFGDDLFVRVSAEHREQIAAQGGRDFAPMPGRPMKGYMVVKEGWMHRPAETARWVEAALVNTLALPGKPPRTKKRS